VVRDALGGGFGVVGLGNPVGTSSVVSLETPDVGLIDVEMPAIDDKAAHTLMEHRPHDCRVLLSPRPSSND
jgi:hypothetical protein